MMYLGDKAVGINHTNVLAHGIFIPENDVSSVEIDTGVNSWTHFLIVTESTPFDNNDNSIRELALRYIDINANFRLNAFTSSTGGTYANNLSCSKLDEYGQKVGSVAKWQGIAAQIGKFIAGKKYYWYAW